MVEITVAPYLAGMVNHATMNERVKITDYRRSEFFQMDVIFVLKLNRENINL